MINRIDTWIIADPCHLFKVQLASMMQRWIFLSWWGRLMKEHSRWPPLMGIPETAMRTKGICQRKTNRQPQWIKPTLNSSICWTKCPRPSATLTPSRPPPVETSRRRKMTKKTRPLHEAPPWLWSRTKIWVQGRKKRTLSKNRKELTGRR
jgi:hypothetical protein